jgi:predicted TIM-barrel fold metal-dependent hydrolase
MASGAAPGDFVDAYPRALAEATEEAVGLKSIVAYRDGLDFDPRPPSPGEVETAAAAWNHRDRQRGRWRLDDPVLLRHVIWAGVRRGLPIQFHVGYGDADVDLHRCNPLLMTDWLRATRDLVPAVMLLHTYPYHREAGYLAHVFPHVYADVGLALNYTGARSAAVLAESLELTPFHKALYSSDAFGAAELHYLGAVWFRRGLISTLSEWVTSGDADVADAARIARLVGAENATRVYGLR